MKKSSANTIDAYFKRKNVETQTSNEPSNPPVEIDQSNSEKRSAKSLRVEINEGFDINSLERDLGLRSQIWKYSIEKRDEVRRAYIKVGSYQCVLSKYPKYGQKHSRSFQQSWFKLFPFWLEYSLHADAAFVFHNFYFIKKMDLLD